MRPKHWDPFREMEAMLRGWSPPGTASHAVGTKQ